MSVAGQLVPVVVRVIFSCLSALRLAKFVLIVLREAEIRSVDCMVVIVLIIYGVTLAV